MSGTRGIFGGGYPGVAEDMQRVADAAADADDNAFMALVAPGTNTNRIMPLRAETSSNDPKILLDTTGLADGRSFLRECVLFAGGVNVTIDLAKVTTGMSSPQFAANSSGSTRYDVVYATIARATSVSASRKIKDPTTGQISTQTVPLAEEVTLALTILTGSAAVPTSPYGVPADAGGAHNFMLGYVAIPNGYVLGQLVQLAWITQAWPRVQHTQRHAESIVPGSMMSAVYSAGVNGRATTVMSRFVRKARRAFVFQHKSSSATWVTLDAVATFSYFRRVLTAFLVLPVSHAGAHPPPESVTLPGRDNGGVYGPYFTGDGAAGALITDASGLALRVDTSGNLQVQGNYAPVGSSGDNWYIEVEVSDSFFNLGTDV